MENQKEWRSRNRTGRGYNTISPRREKLKFPYTTTERSEAASANIDVGPAVALKGVDHPVRCRSFMWADPTRN